MPSQRRDTLAVALGALGVQGVQRTWLLDDPAVRGPIIDGATFHQEALRLLAGAPAPREPYWQSPWYTWFLAGTYRLLGATPARALALQSLCAIACAVLVHTLARRLEVSRATALGAGLAAALYGPLLFFASQLIAAPLDAAAALVALLAAIAVPPARGALAHLGCGLALGFAVAQRGTLAPFALWSLVLLGRARVSLGWRGSLWRAGAWSAGVAIAALPVALGNLARTGHFTPLTTNAGINLWLGNNPRIAETTAARPGWNWEWITLEPLRHNAFGSFERTAWFSSAARRWVFEHPLEALGWFVRKFADTLNGLEIPRNLDPYGELARTPLTAALLGREGLRVPFGLVLPLAALGLRARLAEGAAPHATRTTVAFVGLGSAGIAAFLPAGRYRLGVALALLPFAAEGVRGLVATARRQRAADVRGLVFALGLLAFANLCPAFTGPDLSHVGPLQAAAAFHAMGAHARARALLEHDLARRPEGPDTSDRWNDLATNCHLLGDDLAAERALGRALALEPRNFQAANRLGALRLARGNARGAAEAFAQGLRVAPTVTTLWEGLAVARRALGDLPGAQQAESSAARIRARVRQGHP